MIRVFIPGDTDAVRDVFTSYPALTQQPDWPIIEEYQGQGMFTYFLLKGLGEGKSSAKSLFGYASPRAQDEARRQNRQQTPVFLGADSPL